MSEEIIDIRKTSSDCQQMQGPYGWFAHDTISNIGQSTACDTNVINSSKKDISNLIDKTTQFPSYAKMIGTAILESTSLRKTLQQIYGYMEQYYPFLAKRGPSWKNSVRHTLSLNDNFVKIHRADSGKLCDWTIHSDALDNFKKGNFKKIQHRRKAQRRFLRQFSLRQRPAACAHHLNVDTGVQHMIENRGR